jgi:hypothetical protein
LAGFPAGVKFAPSDQELIEHLESMVLVKEGGGSRAHPLLSHFISTIEGGNDICYTHPENLPGEIAYGVYWKMLLKFIRDIDIYQYMVPCYHSIAICLFV